MQNTLMRRSLYAIVLITVAFLHDATAQEIGLQMGSMRKMFKEGMPATLARIKELGITELEGGFGRGVNRDEFKRLLQQHGLKIVATGAAFERLQHPDSLRQIIANAKELGAQYVVCYWIPHNGDDFTFSDMQKA